MPDLSEDLRDYFDALIDAYDLDDVARRSDQRGVRRSRYRMVTAAALLGIFAAAAVLAVAISRGRDDRAIAGDTPRPSVATVPIVVPSVAGLTVRDADRVLHGVGLVARVDPRLDSDDPDATVIAQEPGPATSIPTGSVVGLRTAGPAPLVAFQCANTTVTPDASADALPAAGQTDLDNVRQVLDTNRAAILTQFDATRAILVHRDGRVWIPDGTSNPRIEQRADYQIAVELPPAACPASAASFGGVPIAFVQRLVTPGSTGESDPAIPAAIADLATKIECAALRPRTKDPPPGPNPIHAYNCHIGDEHLGLFTYTARDASTAFDQLARMCAPAVGGDTWIVWADTNEAATQVHMRLGGRLSTVKDSC
jgi:hypothetical protein